MKLLKDVYDKLAFPCYAGLPPVCAAVNLETDLSIIIRRGPLGYWAAKGLDVDAFNEIYNVTPGQKEAMIVGSMFGWHTPGADPNARDRDGNFLGEPFGKHARDCERPAIAAKQ